MKKIIILLVMTLATLNSFSQIKFPEEIENVDSTKHLMKVDQLEGGYWQIDDETARDAIPADKRAINMMVSYNDSTFRYDGPDVTTPEWVNGVNWSLVSSPGGLGGIVLKSDSNTIFYTKDSLDRLFVPVTGGTFTGDVLAEVVQPDTVRNDNGNGLWIFDTDGVDGGIFYVSYGGGHFFEDRNGGGFWFNSGTGTGETAGGFTVQDGKNSKTNPGSGIYMQSDDGTSEYGYVSIDQNEIEFYTDNNVTIELSKANGAIFTDDRTPSLGFQYAADYSSGFTARSFIDSGYAAALADSAASGLDTYIQYNSSGVFGSSSKLKWDNANVTFDAGNRSGSVGFGSTILNGGTTTDANEASGNYSFASGASNIASGLTSNAIGYNNNATGDYSFSANTLNTSSGESSTAFGRANTASGIQSLAIGNGTIATGTNSIATGLVTISQSYAEVVIGRYNDESGTTGSWVATDPIFTAGNGASAGAKNNAFQILKNGNTTIDGNLNVGDTTEIESTLGFDSQYVTEWATQFPGDSVTDGSGYSQNTLTEVLDVILEDSLLLLGKIDFDTSTNSTPSEGNLNYDASTRSLVFVNDIANFEHNLGYELVTRVYNNTGVTINDGQVVRLVGNYKDDGIITPTIRLAGNSSSDSTLVLGMATVDIADGNYGIITLRGEVKGLNTTFCANDSCMFYLGEGGNLIASSPEPPKYSVLLGQIYYSDADSGRVFFNPCQPQYDPSPHIAGDTARWDSTITLTQNVYSYLPIGAFSAEDSYGYTLVGDSIQVLESGHVTIAVNLSYTGNIQGDVWRKGIYLNAVEQHSVSRSTSGASVGNSTIIKTLDVVVGDWISFKMTNESATRDPEINDFAYEIIFLHE